MKQAKTTKISQVVVIGTSAGGLYALSKLVAQLREDFPAPILVVQHISADATGSVLLNALKKATKLECQDTDNPVSET